MNYEQKYKEALDAARHIYDDMKSGENFGGMEDLEVIFPELRESEDERIRKHIVTFLLEADKMGDAPEEVAKWLAYLEKQKESLHISETFKENPDSFTDEDERIRKELIRIVDIWTNSSPVVNGIPREILLSYLEKQKEQKHPNGCFTCDEYKKGYEAGRSNGFTAGYNKAMKEQKPAEWSEEDEKMLKLIISELEDEGKDVNTPELYKNEINWLKSLRTQPKAEWSEKDEKMIEKLRSIVNDCAFRNDALDVNGDYCEGDYAELDDWLKSLRPDSYKNCNSRWKPSEEQMKALKWWSELPSCSPGLKSLYEDLKKL